MVFKRYLASWLVSITLSLGQMDYFRLARNPTRPQVVFWGLDLVTLALLVYPSRFLPRFLGVWLAIFGGWLVAGHKPSARVARRRALAPV